MKKKHLFLTTLLSAFFWTSGLNAQTTLEEYNYVTIGYKTQIESGLDMKKGYELKDIDEASTDERKVTLKKLVKANGSNRKTTAYMLTYKKGNGAIEYICIPHPKSESEIRDLFWKALYNGGSDSSYRLQLIAFLLSRTLSW